MYANVLFSLPENTRLELKTPVLGFFETTSRSTLKRTISVMHEPGGPGTERLATNIIRFHLGTPIKLKRSVLGARFIQGDVNDTDRLSTCSFYVNVAAEVKKSTDNYLKTMDMIHEHKSRFTSLASNLCQEVVLPGSDRILASEEDVVERQRVMDQMTETRRRYSTPVPDADSPYLMTTGRTEYRNWLTTNAADTPRTPNLFDDQLEIYRTLAGLGTRNLYYSRGGNRNEASTREASRVNYDGFAQALHDTMNRDGFARQMLQRTQPRAARALEVAERQQIHNDTYDALVAGMLSDYDGDAQYVTYATQNTPTQDRRPHLPQNQRNRGPVPRNQRW